jgi:hypothetical protein
MIKQVFRMLREWMRGPVKQTAPAASTDEEMGRQSGIGVGSIGE